MRRVVMTGAALVGLCVPAVAFDFTARSFGPIFDRELAADHVHVDDECSNPDDDGGLCTYGHAGGFTASVHDTSAAGHRAQSVFFWWSASPLTFHDRPDRLAQLVSILSPQLSPERRAAVVAALAPGGRPEGRVRVGDVHYVMLAGSDGEATLQAYDLGLPGVDAVFPGKDVIIPP